MLLEAPLFSLRSAIAFGGPDYPMQIFHGALSPWGLAPLQIRLQRTVDSGLLQVDDPYVLYCQVVGNLLSALRGPSLIRVLREVHSIGSHFWS